MAPSSDDPFMEPGWQDHLVPMKERKPGRQTKPDKPKKESNPENTPSEPQGNPIV